MRQRTWVPDKENKLHTPEDIAIADISDDFKVDRKNPIIKQLNFGAGIKRREQQRKDLEKLAAKEGYMLVPLEDYQEFLAWKARKKGR